MKCPKHPTYKGVYKPRTRCKFCAYIHRQKDKPKVSRASAPGAYTTPFGG